MLPPKWEWRADLEDIAIGPGNADQNIAVAKHVHDPSCGLPIWLLRLAVAYKFDSNVTSLSAHVADAIAALGDGLELRP